MISILMPVKNAGLFLDECLNSIINQSYQAWELIAVNDHSADNSLDVLKQYATAHSNIYIFNNTGNGIIDALKLAYMHSKGNYITRMDADDIMPDSKLALMHEAILEHPNHLITGHVQYFSESTLGDGFIKYQNWLNSLCVNNTQYSEIYKECVIPSASWMIARSILDKCNAFNPNDYPEDYDLCFRFYKNHIPVTSINKTLHLWRDHEHRASRNDEYYLDSSFLDIKLSYFMKLDYDKTKKLQLWSAGKKGKRAAQFLINQQIEFDWISNNPNKIGHNIYGKVIKDYSSTINNSEASQIIVLVANSDEQNYIREKTNSLNKLNLFWFC